MYSRNNRNISNNEEEFIRRLEETVKFQLLLYYLEKNKIIQFDQCEFKKNVGTEDALIDLFDNLYSEGD